MDTDEKLMADLQLRMRLAIREAVDTSLEHEVQISEMLKNYAQAYHALALTELARLEWWRETEGFDGKEEKQRQAQAAAASATRVTYSGGTPGEGGGAGEVPVGGGQD